jgi:nitroreductase
MVRHYDASRPVPADVVDQIVANGLRAPSAGFSQGWGFLVLDNPADVARFRDAVRPEQFSPIGAISVGYSDEPPRDLRSRRKPEAETVHRGRWNRPAR